MIISPFSSIFFSKRRCWGEDSPNIQIFAPTDTPVVEIIRASGEFLPECQLTEINTGAMEEITPDSYRMGDGWVDIIRLSQMAQGCYYLTVGEEESEPFRVTADEIELSQSVLIRYSPYDNRGRRDVVAIVGEDRVVFDFRVQGGFKDDGITFGVDNEQFTTQEADVVELYGRESTIHTLTVGLCDGVPIWFGELLNRLLTCRYVFIGGQRYARHQQSVPEITQTLDGVNSFVITQQLSPVKYLQPQSL